MRSCVSGTSSCGEFRSQDLPLVRIGTFNGVRGIGADEPFNTQLALKSFVASLKPVALSPATGPFLKRGRR
jgi:hypothetical protein